MLLDLGLGWVVTCSTVSKWARGCGGGGGGGVVDRLTLDSSLLSSALSSQAHSREIILA
jgi:hypothetical protein